MTTKEEQILIEKIENLKGYMSEKFDDQSKVNNQILEQAKYTNGKVANLIEWRIKADVAIKIISTFITLIMIPIIILWINKNYF